MVSSSTLDRPHCYTDNVFDSVKLLHSSAIKGRQGSESFNLVWHEFFPEKSSFTDESQKRASERRRACKRLKEYEADCDGSCGSRDSCRPLYGHNTIVISHLQNQFLKTTH